MAEPHHGPAVAEHSLRDRLRTFLPVAIGLAALAVLVLGTDPRAFAWAIAHFAVGTIPLIVACAAGALILQGIRWHFLLRELSIPVRMRESVLLSVAGQAITPILPLGDLTRAIFVTEAKDANFGQVSATVTVQELTYTLLLVLSAVPALLQLQQSLAIVVVTVLAVVGIIAILTVPQLFHVVHAVVARTPVLRRFVSVIDELQHETVELLHRPDTAGWSVLDLARVLVSATIFYLVVEGLAPHSITWWEATFVFAVSYVGGAISLIPGGAGATEATTVGALLLLGLGPGAATAAALLQRVFVSGVTALMGFGAYAIARRRYQISGLSALRARAGTQKRGSPTRAS